MNWSINWNITITIWNFKKTQKKYGKAKKGTGGQDWGRLKGSHFNKLEKRRADIFFLVYLNFSICIEKYNAQI